MGEYPASPGWYGSSTTLSAVAEAKPEPWSTVTASIAMRFPLASTGTAPPETYAPCKPLNQKTLGTIWPPAVAVADLKTVTVGSKIIHTSYPVGLLLATELKRPGLHLLPTDEEY